MKILALNTSGTITTWAGVENEAIIDPVDIMTGRRHDAILAPGISEWLKRNRWDRMDAVAVVTGPGGFTGLRVGVAFASAYALARGIPMLPLNTFEVLSARLRTGVAWVLVPTRKGYCRGRMMRAGIPPQPIDDPSEILVGTLPPLPAEKIYPIGEGYERYREAFDKALGNRIIEKPELLSPATALAEMTRHYWRMDEGQRRMGKGQRAKGKGESEEAVGQRANSPYVIHPIEVDIDYGSDFLPTR